MTIPSIDSKPLAEKHRPRTKTPFMTARVPLRDRPRVQNDVRSSFKTSSRNPSCSGEYWPIQAMKSARRSSLRSEATFLIFFSEIPANEFPVDSSEVRRNKAVSLKQILKLVKEPVWGCRMRRLRYSTSEKCRIRGRPRTPFVSLTTSPVAFQRASIRSKVHEEMLR